MDQLSEIQARFDSKGVCTQGGDYHIDVAFLLKVLSELSPDVLGAALKAASATSAPIE